LRPKGGAILAFSDDPTPEPESLIFRGFIIVFKDQVRRRSECILLLFFSLFSLCVQSTHLVLFLGNGICSQCQFVHA
jgi:hypothetical protein